MLLSALLMASLVHAEPEVRVFPLRVHAVPGFSREALSDRVEKANAIFAAAGVRFEVSSMGPLAEAHAHLVSREDRDALGRYIAPRAIDVFVVESLMDVDTPPLPRRGVHWRDRGRPGVRYVIITKSAGPFVFAHELGHYFGNGHSSKPGNLMSYAWLEGLAPTLDPAQLRRIRGAARELERRFHAP